MAQRTPDPRRLADRGDNTPGADRRSPVLLERAHRESAEDIRRSIEASRQQITENLELLQEEFEERVDWRGWVREHPWESLGIAFAVGVFIGARPYL